MLEAGSVKVTNVQNILFKNLMDACVGTFAWYLFGHAAAYGDGENNNGFIGRNNVALSTEQDWIQWFSQWAYVSTAMTIVSGSVAERCTLSAYFLYTFLLAAWVFPIIAHWMWDGKGWLSPFNENAFVHVIDFAGCSVVHMVGGFSGLLGAVFLGPRLFRFEDQVDIGLLSSSIKSLSAAEEIVSESTAKHRREQKLKQLNVQQQQQQNLESVDENKKMVGGGTKKGGTATSFKQNIRYLHERRQQTELGNNVPFQVLGTLILWFGWYGFNCGSTGGANGLMHVASKCAVTTTMAAAGGGLTSAIIGRVIEGYFSLPRVCNGILAGLVSITASCPFVDSGDAIAIGIIGAILYYLSSQFLEILHIDDPLDAFPVHGICGIWGMIVVAIFGDSDYIIAISSPVGGYVESLSEETKGYRLGVQLFAIFMVIVWVTAWVGTLFAVLSYFGKLRVSREEEIQGMDVKIHGGQAVDMRITYRMGGVSMREYRANAFEQGHGGRSYVNEDIDEDDEDDDDDDNNGELQMAESDNTNRAGSEAL